MSDTTTDTKQTQTKDTPEDTDATATAEGGEESKATPATPPTAETITKADLENLLNKARTQEKSKQHDQLKKRKAELDDLRKQLAEKETSQAELAAKLEDIQNKDLTDSERALKRLEEVEASNKKLQQQLEIVASEAASKLEKAELARYRERVLRESGIQLTELVSGDTKEEINESLENAKARELVIFEAAKAKAEKELRKQQGANVPKPISPVPQPGAGDLAVSERREVAKMKSADYQKIRAKLIAEARQKAGV